MRYLNLLLLAGACCAQNLPDPTLGEWTFTTPGDTRGWSANSHIADMAATGNALHGRATGSDPMFLSPKVEIRNQPSARLEIRLRADRGGSARFYWAPATTGRFGGFEPNKSLSFLIAGDGQFHDYVLFPNWADDAMLYRLRVNIPSGAAVDIAGVRVSAFAVSAGEAAQPRWDFASGAQGWRALEAEAGVTAAAGGLGVRPAGGVTLVSPRTAVVPSKAEWIAVRMQSDVAGPLSVWWSAPGCKGIQTLALNAIAGPEFHTYNLNAGGARCWPNGPDRIGLQLSAGSRIRLQWLRVTELPEGESDIVIDSLTAVRAINRRGRSFEVACTVSNRGGRAATGLRATIAVPKGVVVEQSPAALAPVMIGEPQRLVWRLRAEAAMTAAITVKVEGATETAQVSITEPPLAKPASYVPEPKPVDTPYEIGAYYYPGWWDSKRWDPIRRFPGRTPVLGYYREGDPTVVDWQIKYAVEHGVKFLAVDWYWRDGKEDLRGLYSGLFTARYRKLLKFCFLYANHDPFNVHDRAEWRKVVSYWLEQYFQRDEFYKIEGKPVIVMFSPGNLRTTLGGSEGVKAALEEAREMARKAGLPGIYFMACASPETAGLRTLHDEGYDVATAYNYPSAGANQGNRSPYHDLVDGYVSIWDKLRAAGPADYLLAPLSGWDPRPWHGENTLARIGNTPQEFRRMLVAAKERMDPKGPPSRRVMIIEAWNEFGEGSTVEPDLEDGFGKVDAIREVFAPQAGPHVDVTPEDVGMPLIEWPEAAQAAAQWTFAKASEWKGWNAGGVAARKFGKALIRISASADAEAKLYWQTEDAPGMSAVRAIPFAMHAGATVYEVPLARSPHWRGIIARLRLDVAGTAKVEGVTLQP